MSIEPVMVPILVLWERTERTKYIDWKISIETVVVFFDKIISWGKLTSRLPGSTSTNQGGHLSRSTYPFDVIQ